MGKLFGTDGVRGVANVELTAELAFKIGRAGAQVLTKDSDKKPVFLVGRDTRASGDMLECALVAGICSVGGNAVSVGIAPTPAVSFLTRRMDVDAGVVISASHNPFEDNGIKFFNKEGYKLSDEIENKIEELIFSDAETREISGKQVGRFTHNHSLLSGYMKFAMSTIDVPLQGLKVALDCANGASYECVPHVFEQLGADVVVINNKPNGTNINSDCGSTHIERLQRLTVEQKCDIGFAFDGDADRVLAVDENGEIIDGDKILAICGLELKKQGKLKNNTIVATVMSNLGLSKMARETDVDLLCAKVGDRYVLEEMQKGGYILGGEQSGHIIFLEHNTTGDGLVTALQIAAILKKGGKTASCAAKIMNVFPQVLVNVRVDNSVKNAYMQNSEIATAIENLEKTFEKNGRVLIRPSGTEPLVRVMVEGEDIQFITKKANELAQLIKEKL